MSANNYASNSISPKALIIGANGGIGSSVALALSKQGIETALVGRNEKAINNIAKVCGDTGSKSIPLVCDIAKISPIKSIVNKAIIVDA